VRWGWENHKASLRDILAAGSEQDTRGHLCNMYKVSARELMAGFWHHCSKVILTTERKSMEEQQNMRAI